MQNIQTLSKLKVPEELEGWVSSNFVFLSEFAFLSSVDLAELDGRLLFGQDAGSLCVLWSEGLAVTAPGGIELNKDKLVVGDGLEQ